MFHNLLFFILRYFFFFASISFYPQHFHVPSMLSMCVTVGDEREVPSNNKARGFV